MAVTQEQLQSIAMDGMYASNAGAIAGELPWMACMAAMQDDCMDAGGTTPWMGEVERRLEQPSRATHEQLQVIAMDGMFASNVEATACDCPQHEDSPSSTTMRHCVR